MVAGLRIAGAHGVTQIDERYRNLFVTAQGSATTTVAGNPGTSTSRAIIDIAGGDPLLALSGSAYAMILDRTSPSAGNWRYTVLVGEPVGASIDYYVIDTSDNATPGSFGLRVWDAQGRLAFDSGKKPARVAAVLSGTMSAGSTVETDALPSGRAYAVMPCRCPTYLIRQPNLHQFFNGMVRVNGASVQRTMRMVYQDDVGGQGQMPAYFNHYEVVFDVTNY